MTVTIANDGVLTVLGAAGLTIIISLSSLLMPVRELFNRKATAFIYKMLTCPMCCGVWVGLFMTWIKVYHPEVLPYIAYPCAISLSSWAFANAFKK